MKKFLPILVVIVVVGIIGSIIYLATKSSGSSTATTDSANNSPTTTEQPKSLVSGDITIAGATATIYYGNGCPHCANLEKWLVDNNFLPNVNPVDQTAIDSWAANAKIKFAIKEVWYNQTNSAELSDKAAICKIPEKQVGVPFMFDSATSKCYTGETDIENYFLGK
ncbi:MAG: hypothetical protein NTW79_03135 [Candidatus Berkelbacteria bacterium]|nr:hypothetical protein [Candidatus Berkelbacteria bacterium]